MKMRLKGKDNPTSDDWREAAEACARMAAVARAREEYRVAHVWDREMDACHREAARIELRAAGVRATFLFFAVVFVAGVVLALF